MSRSVNNEKTGGEVEYLEMKQEIRRENLRLLEDLLTQIGRNDLVENLNEFKSKCGFDCNVKSGSMGFQVDDSMEDVPDAAEQTPNGAGNNNDPTSSESLQWQECAYSSAQDNVSSFYLTLSLWLGSRGTLECRWSSI